MRGGENGLGDLCKAGEEALGMDDAGKEVIKEKSIVYVDAQ